MAAEVGGIETEAPADVEPDVRGRVEDLLVGMLHAVVVGFRGWDVELHQAESQLHDWQGQEEARPAGEGGPVWRPWGRGVNDMLGMAGGILTGAVIADMLF